MQLRVNVDGLALTSSVPVRDRPINRLVDSLKTGEVLKSQVRQLWTTRRGRTAWILFVELVLSLSQQSLPREIRQGLLRKVFGLLGAQLLTVFGIAFVMSGVCEHRGIDMTCYPLSVLFLSVLPHPTLWLLNSAKMGCKPMVYLSQSHPLNIFILATHTLIQGFIWGLLDAGIGSNFLLQACLVVGVSFSVAALLAGCRGPFSRIFAPMAASPKRMLLAGWFVGAVVVALAGPALGATAWTWEIAVSVAALFLLDAEWSNRAAFAKGCPDTCFVLVGGMCRGMVVLTHAAVSGAVLIRFTHAYRSGALRSEG